LEARIVRDVLEELGQAERDKIVERTGGGKRRRHLEGLPSGGSAGPLYGYAPGERKIVHGRQAGCLTWVIDEAKAQWVRWLFETVASTDPADLSLRQLTGELERRGAPTATGKAHWDTTRVRYLLRNPRYCGRGRNGRFTSEWVRERDAETGHVREVKRAHDLLRAPAAYQVETVPLADGAIPPIVPPDLFDQVQGVLATAAALHNRAGPRRTDPLAHSTLLDGGYIYCAECGAKMTRFWWKRTARPYYQCNKGAGTPHHEHLRQSIAAHKVEDVLLKTLAQVLTDPEGLLLIADAAETERLRAEADLAVAEARDAATTQRLDALHLEQGNIVTALTALAQVPHMEAEVARLRSRLTALDGEEQDLLTLRSDATRATQVVRAAILRSLFTTRDLLFTPDGGLEEIAGTARTTIGPRMTNTQAAAFLAVPEGSDLGLPVQAGEPFSYQTDTGEWVRDVMAHTVLTADVVYARLTARSRDRLRTVLRSHGVKVLVKPPRPRTEWATQGMTSTAERAVIVLHNSLVLRPAQVGSDGKNVCEHDPA